MNETRVERIRGIVSDVDTASATDDEIEEAVGRVRGLLGLLTPIEKAERFDRIAELVGITGERPHNRERRDFHSAVEAIVLGDELDPETGAGALLGSAHNG